MYCPPLKTAYSIVPPQVSPEGNAGLAVDDVIIVPLLVTVDKVPLSAYVLIFNVPPAGIVKVPLSVKIPLAVFVPLVLLSVNVLYVPAITVCDPEVTA